MWSDCGCGKGLVEGWVCVCIFKFVCLFVDNAKYAVEFYLRGDGRFKMVEYLPDMGEGRSYGRV